MPSSSQESHAPQNPHCSLRRGRRRRGVHRGGVRRRPAGAGTASVSAPSSVSLPITSYYQMAVDSADGQVFISQGTAGGDSIVVTDFSGNVVGSIAEPSPVKGLTQRATFPLPAVLYPG